MPVPVAPARPGPAARRARSRAVAPGQVGRRKLDQRHLRLLRVRGARHRVAAVIVPPHESRDVPRAQQLERAAGMALGRAGRGVRQGQRGVALHPAGDRRGVRIAQRPQVADAPRFEARVHGHNPAMSTGPQVRDGQRDRAAQSRGLQRRGVAAAGGLPGRRRWLDPRLRAALDERRAVAQRRRLRPRLDQGGDVREVKAPVPELELGAPVVGALDDDHLDRAIVGDRRRGRGRRWGQHGTRLQQVERGPFSASASVSAR